VSRDGWIAEALRSHRVLLLDQRGTGRSTRIDGRAIAAIGGATEQAAYLERFRADSIVKDAEWIRAALGVERWSILGQSFGGFCAFNYLSQAPESLSAALVTGGVPPIGLHPDEIYRATYARMLERNRRYYQRYPGDRERVRALHERLQADDFRLPNGDRLTFRRFRQVGSWLGMSDGAERLHYLLELPFESPGFRHDVQNAMVFARNPIYAILHESSYSDGHVTDWSAERVQPAEYLDDATLLTGEHVFPWMFEDYGALRPLQAAAELLAKEPWPALYDAERLADNEVPVAAAIYAEDAYVESTLSMQTVDMVPNVRPWLTNEFEHNGLRADGDRILSRLIELATGRA
jgi:pimeloyl-ACP methyl ester carboxylesterase